MIEDIILANLLDNEPYFRKVIPFIKPEYFVSLPAKTLFEIIRNFSVDYAECPSREVLAISLDEHNNLSGEVFKQCGELLSGLKADPNTTLEWLVDQTEKYCQERAVYNAVMDSIKIIDKTDKVRSKGAIPTILQEALSVSFDTVIGHSYTEEPEERYAFYHEKEEKIPFDLEFMNRITRGGVSRKSLNVILAPTGVGKTLFMTHCASYNLSAGYNVLYISMEMSEKKIAERIDANLMGLTVDELKDIPKDVFLRKAARINDSTRGRLIIKEYPTGSANASHFRHLIQELKIKKNFTPDVVYIDYLNICASARMKMGGSINLYSYIKSIAEELRGLSVEFNVPIITATQSNRDSYGSSDMNLDSTSESWGVPATADLMIGLISTEELESMRQIMVKQLKNRYGDPSTYKRFILGIDRAHMRLYNVDDSAQDGLVDSGIPVDRPVMDNTLFGGRLSEEKGSGKKNFGGLRL